MFERRSPTSWHVSSCIRAGAVSPARLVTLRVGICLRDRTPQLSAASQFANRLRCIAGTGLDKDSEAARVTADRKIGPW